VNTADSPNHLLKFKSTVAVLTNIEINGPKSVHRWWYERQTTG